MKNVFLVLLIALSLTSAAQADMYVGSLEESALQQLMKENPVAKSKDDFEDTEVNNLIALGMLSFNSNGKIILSIITNSCVREAMSAANLAVYKCSLVLSNSDRDYLPDGGFSGPQLESSLLINYTYTVDEVNDLEKIYDVTFSFAG